MDFDTLNIGHSVKGQGAGHTSFAVFLSQVSMVQPAKDSDIHFPGNQENRVHNVFAFDTAN
jgi:hypothetical protein